MKFFLTAAALALPAASAFTTSSRIAASTTSLNAATNSDDLNGWVPDESAFAFGLPGSLDPVGDFDPLGFAERADITQMKAYREAETTHGRVAMLAFIGFLVTEQPLEFHPLFETASKDIGPAIRHLDEVRASTPFFFELLAIVIGAAEFGRSVRGWEQPGNDENRALREGYYPGDLGFDPLGLKPTGSFEEFSEMSTKELQHGRLAMLAVAGIVAQELVNGKEIFVTLGVAPDVFDPDSLPVKF
eukprot:CAMPEP_0197173238 /NCGR_PEP_ID=MMETSP1423-20130617/256_1 /TAXON_ID=476441 /ORGANISM="Pseudo-nitzschia heimii, Strain UNC1101" /LENGTH=244 /DNA_ID=CAMNT_0042622033 /DNA_START=684 /DNA_END=1418 /DNA_ORIENTATION=-